MWDYAIKSMYSYGYFIAFLVAVFVFAIICCYGKKTRKKNKTLWTDMYKALTTGTNRKRIHKKHEHHSRAILERLLRVPFTSIRPDFLKYIHGKNLELDGYNTDLNVAFEYQGIQHRQFTPLFHKSYTDFDKQVARDEWKHAICRERGIRLLCIPDTVHYDDLEEYITAWCKEQRLL